ncbi:MAG: hypothetical protein ACI84K_001305 [Pseudohongiellaceae bacterium]|jgi:hypothetical protein
MLATQYTKQHEECEMAKTDIRSNEISGIVLHKQTKKPLKNLLIVAFDLDPDKFNPDQDGIRVNPDPQSPLNDPATFKVTQQEPRPNGVPGDRLGSVLTDGNGQFTINYEDEAFRIRRKKVGMRDDAQELRPDLFLVVLIAEESGQSEFDNVLFRSNWARINAGRVENYVIEISSADLKRKGLHVPTASSELNSIDAKIATLREERNNVRDFRLKMTEMHRDFDQEDLAEKEEVRGLVTNALIRDIRDFGTNNKFVRFVQADETIETVQRDIYNIGANQFRNVIKSQNPQPGEGVKISLYLTHQEKEDLNLETTRFTHDDNKDYFRLDDEAAIRSLLFKKEDDDGINSILFSENPINKYCLEKSKEAKCAQDFLADPPPVSPQLPEGVPSPSTTTQNADIPELIDKVLFSKSSTIFDDDEDQLKRPDATSVQASVDSFALQKGPADATAFYDFNSLQIAFSHVWKQLVDQTVVNLGEEAHFGLKNEGKKSYLDSAIQGAAMDKAFLSQVVTYAIWKQDPVPAAVVKNFDVHDLEYEALSENQKEELKKIANEINKLKENHPIPLIVRSGPFNTPSTRLTYVDHSDKIESLYDQGEMILENIRINKPNSTNIILRELQERLQGKYEFTVFAADKDYNSVNFGLMNTYRQKWEPISYQAGKLAKTIPMAPKEERKYSVKITRKLKNSEKQAQKYNSAIDSEFNLTSRAESEIVSKAQKKSDFEFNINAKYGQSSSKLGLGKDASKDSSEAKKSFRESVIKSAQEFKDEWSLTVDSEESFDSEQTESGTISNPNDELSVTYLFYQLQRRYRVSEQLYRTMPVVLVALDVPSPHEITEGWVIANDWIINRALLDDSFRDALELLAKESIGNDFALRELRKNMREQRRLVRSLEKEFAKLERDVANKYSTLQASVDERIDEEHDKRFYKRTLFNQLFGGGSDPAEKPDPEMAKALEQAAADDHQYAVEQSKQLSMAVQRESNAMRSITRDYNKTMKQHLNALLAVKRLLTHIRENILFYMQAIWSMEPPDQRFMRLYKVKVPSFEAERTCTIAADETNDIFGHFRKDGKKKYDAWIHGTIKEQNGAADIEYKSLVEVADLDTVLGFKGNYIMFPLKKHNALTELMAAPYVDEAFGAMDPDQLSNVNLEELSRYICCLHEEDPEQFETLKPVLNEWLKQLLADPLRNGDEIIIPTDSLFIEMLPSDKSLLEDFKLKHRQMDVMKVRAEVRQMELENVRYAARLLADDYADPDIDKKIVVHGGSSVIVGDE